MPKPVLTTLVGIYVVTVAFLTIRIVGQSDSELLLVLVALTLPWSLVSVAFLWSLIHGASLWFFWLVFLGGGAANAFLIYRYLPRAYARLSRMQRGKPRTLDRT
jgi:hypothetical protein